MSDDNNTALAAPPGPLDVLQSMGGEFMDAMDRKDRKGIMSALEAIVLSCRGKE